METDQAPLSQKGSSIHTRPEITAKYEILDRVGSGAYAEVYRGRRLSDDLTVALKEVHDSRSASREIEALRLLQGSQNVVVMHEFFWRDDDEDAVIVLEFLRTDLAAVIAEASGGGDGGLGVGEAKRWMIQVLSGVDACHRNMIVHRDLKPSNFLVSDDGVLKLADFGQARILMEGGFDCTEENSAVYEHDAPTPPSESSFQNTESSSVSHEEYFRVLDEMKNKSIAYDTDKDTNIQDGNTSCLATCTTSDIDDDLWKAASFTYENEEDRKNEYGCLTSGVGTRWYKAPELLCGSTCYGLEVDLWSLGCVFAELLTLKVLFPGTCDADQIRRITSVLGKIDDGDSLGMVEGGSGIEACMEKCSDDGVSLVKKLVCYEPARRASAMELLHDDYFCEEPLPVPVSELRLPFKRNGQGEEEQD